MVTDLRAWQPFQWCCLLQKPLIFIFVGNNHLLMSVLKYVICAAEPPNFRRSVPPPIADPKARHQPWLYPSSSSPLQILLPKPTPGSSQQEEHVLESRSHCVLADGWQPGPLVGSKSLARSPYLYTSLSRRRVLALPQLPHPTDVSAVASDVSSRHRGGQMERFPPPTALSRSVWEVRRGWEIVMSQCLQMASHCREVPERKGGDARPHRGV